MSVYLLIGHHTTVIVNVDIVFVLLFM